MMNRTFFRFSFFILLLLNCEQKTDPIGPTRRDNYYPLQTGNTWHYAVDLSDYFPDMQRTVSGVWQKDKKRYFIIADTWGTQPEHRYADPDTIYQDSAGRIWKHIGTQDYLWFDFSAKDGAIWHFNPIPQSSENGYTVKIKKGVEVQTPIGKFTNCIEFFFDVPQVMDEEIWYVFAPQIGMVKRIVGEGPTLSLESYNF